MADYVLPETANVLVLVAHPDDETLWTGGTLLTRQGWTAFVGTLCRASDTDRAPRFRQALTCLDSQGAMADLDDGPLQLPLDPEQVRLALRSVLPSGPFDLLITHSPQGEYTRHLRHEEVARCVLGMWIQGEIVSRELWLFAYDDEGGHCLPHAQDNADVVVDLSEEVWAKKQRLLADTYGFASDSWEYKTTPRREAFWRLVVPNDARAWLLRRNSL